MAEGPTPFFVAACALSRRTQHSQAWVRVLRSFRVTSRTFSLYSSHTSRFSEICYQTPEVIAQKNSGLWAKSWHRTFSGTAHDLGLHCLGGGSAGCRRASAKRQRCTVLLVPFCFEADALKAGAEMGDQVLNIVRIKAQLKLTMSPMHVPSCS